MVGRAASIRYILEVEREKVNDGHMSAPMSVVVHELRTAGLVILPSFMGTLKSTRMRTRFSLTSRSVIASLLERDMVDGERDADGLRSNVDGELSSTGRLRVRVRGPEIDTSRA